MLRDRGASPKMTIEVHWKHDVRQWEQRLAGIPRRGERLVWTCHTETSDFDVVAEVQHLVWRADGPSSEGLQPFVVCKALSVTVNDRDEIDDEIDLPVDGDWDEDFDLPVEEEFDNDDWDEDLDDDWD